MSGIEIPYGRRRFYCAPGGRVKGAGLSIIPGAGDREAGGSPGSESASQLVYPETTLAQVGGRPGGGDAMLATDDQGPVLNFLEGVFGFDQAVGRMVPGIQDMSGPELSGIADIDRNGALMIHQGDGLGRADFPIAEQCLAPFVHPPKQGGDGQKYESYAPIIGDERHAFVPLYLELRPGAKNGTPALKSVVQGLKVAVFTAYTGR